MLKLKILLPFIALFLTSAASAEAPDATAKREIAYLFAHLASSGCEFNRNGTWYPSSKAVSHLNRKYEYLLGKGWIPDAEAFIERAATKSSISGKPYQVRCAGDPPIASAAWLRAELARYRAERHRAAQQPSAGDGRQETEKAH